MKIICDYCGKEIDLKNEAIIVTSSKIISPLPPELNFYLCEDCFDLLTYSGEL